MVDASGGRVIVAMNFFQAGAFMFSFRMSSPSYLGVGVAIATGLGGIFGSTPGARAQLDANLQTTLQIFAPPPIQGTQTKPEIAAPGGVAAVNACSLEPAALKTTAKAIRQALSGAPKFQTINIAPQLQEELRSHSGDAEASLSKHPAETCALQSQLVEQKLAAFSTPGPVLTQKGQATKISVNFPFNPTYETDVLKRGSNSSSGISAGFGGNAIVSTGVGPERPFDLIALAAGSASVRYPAYPSKSLDTATEQIAYQFFLGACTDKVRPPACIAGDAKDPPPWATIVQPKAITTGTLALAVLNQTAFMPDYRHEIANLLTPQIILSRQNINFDGVAGTACKQDYYCHYANLSLTVGQTFSDVSSQENANATVSGALGWRINNDWTLAFQSAATARHYERVVGGREDLLLQAGTALTYQPSSNVTFAIPITYFKNYSTVSANAWSGLVIQPTLTLALLYTAPPAFSK